MTATDLLLKIISYLKPYRLKLIIAFIALISVVSSMLLLGHAIRDFIDHGFDPHSSHSSIKYIVILISIFGVGSFIRSYIINTTAELVANQVKFDAFINLKNLHSQQIDALTFSDLASRINSDSEYIGKVIIDVTSFFVRNILMCIGGIILMFITYTSLSIIAFSVIALISLIASFLGKKVRMLAKQAEFAKSKISSLVMESLINYKVTTAFGCQNRLENYYAKLNQITLNKVLLRLKARSVFFASSITTILLTISGIIWYGSQQVAAGAISPGILGAFIFYAIMTATSFGGLIEMVSDLQKNLANCERIFELINLGQSSAIKHSSNKLPLISFPLKGDLKFCNLTYGYNLNTTPIFSNFNLSLPLGTFTTIKGQSGTGKSTLLQLLIGLYEWQSGEIIIGGHSFSNLVPECWNNKLAYVPQDQVFFSGTILDNLTFFADNYSLEEINQLLTELDLTSYIESLPNGLNSDISNMGSHISGGQKQRLAIARALLTSPEILILDEATSQIDIKTEQKVLGVIKNYMKNKTVISAAHRPSAIQMADHIIDLAEINKKI